MAIEIASLFLRPGASPGSLSFGAKAIPSASQFEARELVTVNISHVASLRLKKDQSIEAGKRVHQVDQVMARQIEALDQMRSKLGAILRQYPPFAFDDPERAKYLEAFSGLRAQIEALTWPKEPTLDALIPQQIQLPKFGNVPDVPKLLPDASDDEVRMAYASIETALGVVTGQRGALAESVRTVSA